MVTHLFLLRHQVVVQGSWNLFSLFSFSHFMATYMSDCKFLEDKNHVLKTLLYCAQCLNRLDTQNYWLVCTGFVWWEKWRRDTHCNSVCNLAAHSIDPWNANYFFSSILLTVCFFSPVMNWKEQSSMIKTGGKGLLVDVFAKVYPFMTYKSCWLVNLFSSLAKWCCMTNKHNTPVATTVNHYFCVSVWAGWAVLLIRAVLSALTNVPQTGCGDRSQFCWSWLGFLGIWGLG